MNYTQLSKTVSMALRHVPEKFGLTLSPEGWVQISDLIVSLGNFEKKWDGVTKDDLLQMDAQSGKKRFEIEGNKIRALYGHSTKETQISYDVVEPPEVLYHGTSAEAADLILIEGLKPMGRQYVHLSDKVETATIVGKRKEKQPVLLIVEAKQAYADGVKFYHGNDNTWLAEPIAAKYISKKE